MPNNFSNVFAKKKKKILNHKNGCDPINSEIYWAFEIIWLEKYISICCYLRHETNHCKSITKQSLKKKPKKPSIYHVFPALCLLKNFKFQEGKKIGAILIPTKHCTVSDSMIASLTDIDLTQKSKKKKKQS